MDINLEVLYTSDNETIKTIIESLEFDKLIQFKNFVDKLNKITRNVYEEKEKEEKKRKLFALLKKNKNELN